MTAPANTQSFRHTWKDSAGDKWLITIDYTAQGGRAIPVSLMIRGDGDKELTQRAVRELPFRKMAWISRGGPKQKRFDLAIRTSTLRNERRRNERRGARPLTSEEIELTVETFLEAYRTGRPLVKTVALRFGISEGAANKRIIKLRQEGLLPRSQGGRRTRERP
jgi:hypothetical protein